MTYFNHQHQQAVILDRTDQPVVAHAVSPEFPESLSLQGLADAARVIQTGDALKEKSQDASGMLRVEFVQIPVSAG